MIVVKTIRQTCRACPTQWSGETEDGLKVNARYRWGVLKIEVDGRRCYLEGIGHPMCGSLSYEELKRNTKNMFVWPAVCLEKE